MKKPVARVRVMAEPTADKPYTFRLTGEALDGDRLMFDQVMTWYGLDYPNLVKIERAEGEAALEAALTLGDEFVDGTA